MISYGDSPDLYEASSASCSADAGSAVTGSAEVVAGTSDTALAALFSGHNVLPSGVMRRGHLLMTHHRDTAPDCIHLPVFLLRGSRAHTTKG